ncbi:MAG TPA: hypothetical protein VK627_09420, partial [Edaphobacter sp.]|nr:hypothetical protein [Edaphobacter sp.]
MTFHNRRASYNADAIHRSNPTRHSRQLRALDGAHGAVPARLALSAPRRNPRIFHHGLRYPPNPGHNPTAVSVATPG